MLKTILLSLSLSGGSVPSTVQPDLVFLSAGEHVQQSMQMLHKEMQDDLKAELADTVKRTLEESAHAYQSAVSGKEAPARQSSPVYSPR